METNALNKLAYEAPDTSVDWIEMEECILSTVTPRQLGDMDPNELYDEDF